MAEHLLCEAVSVLGTGHGSTHTVIVDLTYAKKIRQTAQRGEKQSGGGHRFKMNKGVTEVTREASLGGDITEGS